MWGMNDDCVDMVYLDPPFNSKRHYGKPIGGKGNFKDTWTLNDYDMAEHGMLAEKNPAAFAVINAAKYTHGKGTMAYLVFMAVRLVEMKRILNSDTGHIFLHCDDAAGAYLKALMDAIFGKKAYRNTVTWRRTNSHNDATHTFGRTSDYIFHYAMPKAKFNPVFGEKNEDYVMKFKNPDKDPRGPYVLDNLSKPQGSNGYHYKWKGYEPPDNGWRCPKRTMQEHHDNGILYYPSDRHGNPLYTRRIRKKRYLSDYEGAVIGNVWTDIKPLQKGDPEYMDYPTQKPPELMHRIIECSTDDDNLVFDPFCGCASTLVAAEDLHRKWAGCDISELAVDLLIERIVDRKDLVRSDDITSLDRPSVRDDLVNIPHYKTHKQTLYIKQDCLCNGCYHFFPPGGLVIDHMQPQSKGGQDIIENLQLLCPRCNSSKGSKTMAEWIAWRKKHRSDSHKAAQARLADFKATQKAIPA